MDLSEINSNQNRHPWEMTRADFILNILVEKKSFQPQATMLDIGCGDLYFTLKAKSKNEIEIDAVDTAFEENSSTEQGIQKIKHLDTVMHKQYDVICAMDVLEHVEKDDELLNSMIHMLKPNGTLLITVPAFQFLFSYHDLKLKHLRRYHRGHLAYLIDEPEKIEIDESFYFFHSLIYIRVFEKFYQFFMNVNPKKNQSTAVNEWKHPESHPITRSLGIIMSLDAKICRSLSKIGIRLPGLSLCTVIRKK